MSYLEDNERAGRIALPDLVRSFALLGIVLVNVAYFAYPSDVTYHDGGLNSALDKAAYFGVNSFFFLKSYTLFSFMFGVGLAYQMTSSERRGLSFGPGYFRRMFALVILGMLHVTFGFAGDILVIYGLLGCILFYFRNKNQKSLIKVGIVMVIIQILVAGFYAFATYFSETYAADQMNEAFVQMDIAREVVHQVFNQGSLSEVALQRWREWGGMVLLVAPLQAPGVFGFFLLGLAAVRTEALSDPKASLWAKARRVYLPLGLLVSLAGAYVSLSSGDPMSSGALFGLMLLVIAAPFSSIGYIGLIAKWAESPMTPFKTFIARGGTASLTAYLLQSLILSLIFCGYGLGFYAQPGAFACVVIALMTGVFSIIFVSLWRTKYRQGPMEYLLRKWTCYRR